jgi:hypothetical protein
VVGHDQRATVGGDVLDPFLLDPEPVAVVEVEERLDELEDALGPAPVVDLATGVGLGDQLAQCADVRVDLGRALPDAREPENVVGVRIELGSLSTRLFGTGSGSEGPTEEWAVGAQAPASS